MSGPVTPDDELAWVQHELAEAQATIRQISRQIEREQARSSEVAQAYQRTVESLMEIARQNTELERDVEIWRARVAASPAPPGQGELIALTRDEISAVRRAMARLHHPDTGGDSQRMQLWNSALDALERAAASL